jgi:fatty acid desaturase
MSQRARIVAYGAAVALIVAGAACAAAVGGETGEVLALVLIGLGFVALTGLVFLEVGLSEDRERERTARARERRSIRLKRPPRNLERMRGERRRLK